MTDIENLESNEHLPADSQRPSPWMRTALMLAGIYNLTWGAFAIVSPLTIFRIAGADPVPAYPELWQCIGMIVGVYGIGYLIAARAPFVHWPIVLVGLLGKIFGPLGFLIAANSGRLPATFGWTILTNDVIWWIPFTIILWRAAVYHQSRQEELTVRPPVRKIDPLGRMVSQRGASLVELSRRKPLLVVFLRHSGCTFCREAVADVAALRSEIESLGTQIAFVHMGQNEPVELLEKHGLNDLHSFRDPACSLYDTFGLKMGTFSQLLGPFVWWRGLLAFFSGHKAGSFAGNVFRMPGVFLIDGGEVVRGFRHQSAAERPDYVTLATLPNDDDLSSCELPGAPAMQPAVE